ncbi:unnamed protein product [Amoebophrya sp. A120]|nr:unnamed protein product [Amoebophrya sp. A120]|eukprot:GSA120T00006605001.1
MVSAVAENVTARMKHAVQGLPDEARYTVICSGAAAVALILTVLLKFAADMGLDNLFVWHPICMVSGFACMSAGYILVAFPRQYFSTDGAVASSVGRRKYVHLSVQVTAMALFFVGVSFIWRNHARMGKSQFGFNNGVWDPLFPNLVHMASGYLVLLLLVFTQLTGGLGRAFGKIPPRPERLGEAPANATTGLLATPAVAVASTESEPDPEEGESCASRLKRISGKVSVRLWYCYSFVYWNHKWFAMAAYLCSVLCILTAPFPPLWGHKMTLFAQGLAVLCAGAVFWARSELAEK